MIDIEKESEQIQQKAVVAGVYDAHIPEEQGRAHLAELIELAGNLDIVPAAEIIGHVRGTPSPETYFGSGKVEEIRELVEANSADMVIFDVPLTPSQQRNLERRLKVPVLGREEIIIDIFADRAVTREAVMQVELARLQYQLPRLTGAWSHLSRQAGGFSGARGVGEKQIELDRRQVKRRISVLQEDLARIRRRRETERKRRKRNAIPQAAIVGYTNAGKSSLLNLLAGADVMAKDQLFATLDPATRRAEMPGNREILLTDTVGFIRKLPHELVEAFKSTLESAAQADILIIVLDLAAPDIIDHWRTTIEILESIGAGELEKIVVFNKVDLEVPEMRLVDARHIAGDGVFISVKTGEGIDRLKSRLSEFAGRHSTVFRCILPPERHDLAAMAHRSGNVIEQNYGDDGSMMMTVQLDRNLAGDFAPFMIEGDK